MLLLRKSWVSFTTLPLFFQVFAIACSLMFINAAYGFFIESFREARVFLYCSLTGWLAFFLIKLATSNRNLKESGEMQIISLLLLFILLPLFLAFPAWIIAPNVTFIDAYVDTVGAFTTTGLPVFENDFLSRSIHLWRAIIAWFGGGLIWIAAFVILLPASRGGFDVFSNKIIGPNLIRKLTLNERSTTLSSISKKIVPIYVGLTFILWCALTSFGSDEYTSFIRAFSILSTSGISGPQKLGSDGAGFFGEVVMVVFLVSALSFNIFYLLTKRTNVKKLLLDRELRLGFLIVICFTIVLSLKDMDLIMSVYDLNESFIDGLKLIWGNFFTVFSFITTTGYVSSYWEEFQYSVDTPHVTMVLLGLCLFGGGLATTAGGIKLMRISILFSALSAETGKLTHPSSIHGTNLNLKNLEISSFMAWIFFMLFLVSLAVVTIVLSMFGMFFEDAVVLAVACLTSTGPLIDVVGVNSSMISELPYFSKLVLVVSMILGRIEILLALSVINSALRRA